ncbi:MAG: glycosyltransferase, partial [Lentisphaeria bacterium]
MPSPISIGKIVREFYNYDHFFIKSQFSISKNFNKIVIFMESKEVGLINEVNGVKFYHSPFGKSCPKRKLALWVAEIFAKEQVKIIHCDQHSATSVGIAVKKIAKIPYLFSHVHGNNICRGFSRKFFYWWNKKHITKLIACADWVKKDILNTYPTYTAENIVTIANGVDTNMLNPELVNNDIVKNIHQELGINDSDIMFLATCRLSPDKNLHLLFSAFSRLAEDYDNIKLFIAGEGRLRSELEQQIAKLNMNSKIV